MIDAKQVANPDEKSAITLNIMCALPACFSPPDDIDEKAIIHRDCPFFAAYANGSSVGFVSLKTIINVQLRFIIWVF